MTKTITYLGLRVGVVVSLHFQDKSTQFCDT